MADDASQTYPLTWITPSLAVGHAPMSYAELDAIEAQGIDAIVNLCGEFCDLHEIQQKSGFEVYYLPIADETAPDVDEMEKGLAWLDEAIYLGKKVLVHCRFGIGRTGTFVTAYLLRRGLGLKVAAKKLKRTRANPATYRQHKLVKKYGKKVGRLLIREPSPENREVVDLSGIFADYEAVVAEIERRAQQRRILPADSGRCGRDHSDCCYALLELELIEVLYLNNRLNRRLASAGRLAAIERAAAVHKRFHQALEQPTAAGSAAATGLAEVYARNGWLCPLNQNQRCLLYDFRPLACRMADFDGARSEFRDAQSTLRRLSQTVFFTVTGTLMRDAPVRFTLAETVSGHFASRYFHYLARQSADLNKRAG